MRISDWSSDVCSSDLRQIAAALQSEMGQKALGGRIKQRPPRHFAPSRRAHPSGLHQHIERALGYGDAPDFFNLSARDRLMIGDDRKRLYRGPAQPAAFLPPAARVLAQIGCGLEMPFADRKSTRLNSSH